MTKEPQASESTIQRDGRSVAVTCRQPFKRLNKSCFSVVSHTMAVEEKNKLQNDKHATLISDPPLLVDTTRGHETG